MNKTYSEKLKDPRWQKVRLAVLSRDNFTCRDCDDTTEELHVHHCFYTKGNPWDTETDFLLTLCKPCHQNREKIEGRIRELIGVVLSAATIESVESMCEDLIAATSSKSFEVFADLAILDSAEMSYRTDMQWHYDLMEITGDEAVYNSVQAKRKLEEAAP